jgi:hypothetical protein
MTYYNNIMTEKRIDERVGLVGYGLNFVDTHLDSSVIITDVSMEGLRMTRVPRKLAYKGTSSEITISGNLLSESCKLTIMPCWRKRNALYWDVGFYIYRSPQCWKRFVRIIKIQNK